MPTLAVPLVGGGTSTGRKWSQVPKQEIIPMLWPGSNTGGQAQLHPEVWIPGGLTEL